MDNLMNVYVVFSMLLGIVACADNITERPVTCVMRPAADEHINDTVFSYLKAGAHLIRYNININNTAINDLLWISGDDIIYKPGRWSRVASVHGKTLLALVFNYDSVSMEMLSFGVKDIDVNLIEYGCDTYEEKTEALKNIIYNDFNIEGNYGGYREACTEVVFVAGNATRPTFIEKCFMRTPNGKFFGRLIINKWVNVLHTILEIVRIVIICFAPLMFQSWLHTGDVQSSVPYTVHMETEHTMEIVKQFVSEENKNLRRTFSDGTPNLYMKNAVVPMQNLREQVEDKMINKGEKKFHIYTRKMNIVVDHTKLMSLSSVPVNFFTFLKDEIIGCGIMKRTWLKSCSKAGCLFGRWLAKCRPEAKESKFPPQTPTWGTIFRLLSTLLVAMVIVPLPFHIRVFAFFYTESDEMQKRSEAAEILNLHESYHESFWLGLCWPSLVITVYLTYFVTLAVYTAAQWIFCDHFDDAIKDCMYDLREVSYASILSMLCYHLVVPFKEFGFFFGTIIAIPYYVVVMPIAIVVAIIYGTPTLYMFCRFFYNFRPEAMSKSTFCGRNNVKPKSLDNIDIETASVASAMGSPMGSLTFSQIFNLDNISPETRLFPRLPTQRVKSRWNDLCKRKLCRTIFPLFVSSMLVLLMLSVTVMYAEAIRFFLQVIFLALSGLVLNARHVMDYFMLFFWMLMYCIESLKTVRSKYTQMSQHLFKFFMDHLKEEISDATRVPQAYQAHTGFKYFHRERLVDIKERMKKYMNPEDEASGLSKTDDRLIADDGNLYWDSHALILFLDDSDRPRIPRRLFWFICDQLRAPGCPGPLKHSIAEALKQLIYMSMFLVIIYIIIMSFHDVFNPASNNQLFLTVAGGFLPMIIRQLMPSSPKVDLSEYSLNGKIEEILLHYRDTWPAYDLIADIHDGDAAHDENEKNSDSRPQDTDEEGKAKRKEEDIIEIEEIIAETATKVGSTTGMINVGTQVRNLTKQYSFNEGSSTFNFSDPGVRLPRYIAKERLLTFATVTGPMIERNSAILEPLILEQTTKFDIVEGVHL